MAVFPPISLAGDTLGQRHRHLNSLVREAKESGVSILHVETLPEESPIDRLFKIDLAIELQHVDYIIRNLKDDDMLYVSRALKSTWLISNWDIINPTYLEDILFPEMISPAVTKMKHWLYINMRDPAMCQEFYQHYKENTFEFAVKFLSQCSQQFILEAVPEILAKLSPQMLKVLCEKSPKVAKIYFDSLATNKDVKTRYLEQEKSYFNSVKCVLKSDADVFLDITEKYFNMDRFKRFSPLATNYILRHHKTRFMNKLELYIAYFLHIPTVAARLSVEECQEAVLKLARAKYLDNWFEYKVVEPLIKRLIPQKRAAFKKLVFVDKDVGNREDIWAYEVPESPKESDTGGHVFDDQDFDPICDNNDYARVGMSGGGCALKYCGAWRSYSLNDEEDDCRKRVMKTDLDRLFDEFRYIGFDRALYELGQRLSSTGSADRRRNIFLVLVSKTGGRIDAVSTLLGLAVQHSNEPAHTRASILRSLVKRANVWRLPADDWQHLLAFGHGLGLDGAPAEAACIEGLHCVVIRQLLDGKCDQAVCDAFLKDFSSLSEYSLKAAERERVAIGLQNILTSAAVDVEPKVAAERLGKLLDVLKLYRVRVEATSPAVKAVVALASRDAEVARPLLEQLYNARIARRELLKLNMAFRKDEAALVNALRHDLSVLEVEQVIDILAARQTSFDRFVLKLVIYFGQKQDFTVNLMSALKEKIAKRENENSEATCQNVKLARPLVSLLCQDIEYELLNFDKTGKESLKIAAALRACAHRARPIINLVEWGWRKAGVRAVATRAMRCREIERAELIRALAAERRTIRVALALSMRSRDRLFIDTLESAAMLRPVVALRAALLYFHRRGNKSDLRVWDIVKPLLFSVDLKPRERLRQLLGNIDWVPAPIKPDYCRSFYFVINKISRAIAESVLRDLSKHLPETDETIEDILLQILDSDDKDIPAITFPSIFVRYLLLSRNEEDVENRFMKIGNRFLGRLDILRVEKDFCFSRRLDQILDSLVYNSAFLDTKYSSCLTVIERVVTWMETFMPREEYFNKYVQVHLTKLYFNAVRQSMEQMPEVFSDPKRRKSEGVEIVGFVYGGLIMKEIAELVTVYFDSITELYTEALTVFLNDNIMYGRSRANFITSLVKGILAEGVGVQRRMAVYVLRSRCYEVDHKITAKIEEQMYIDDDIKMFALAELYTH